MNLQLTHLAQTAPQAWRNGGGQTRELLAWPPRASSWQLRVSVADIGEDGPFSAFPGVSRAFAVLRGAGVQLRWAANRSALLTTGSAPLRFDGGEPPVCQLLNGATQDLNLMVQRASGQAGMAQADASTRSLPAGPRWRGMYLAEGEAWLQRGDAPATPLAAGTLAWSDNCPHDWQLDGPQAAPQAWWLWLEAPRA